MGIKNINLNGVQQSLVSGTNIKTVNGETVLGSGNIVVSDSNSKPQKDFLDTLRNHCNYPFSAFKKINSTNFSYLAHNEVKGSFYNMIKDVNDDFWKLSLAGFCDVTPNDTKVKYLENGVLDGAFITSGKPNIHTTTIGDKVKVDFNGNGIVFRGYKDTRGGLWRFTLDGNPDNTIDVSSYSDTLGYVNTTLFSGLVDGFHTVVGEFLGDDPANPPSSTARGWLYWDSTTPTTQATFTVLERGYDTSNVVSVLANTSNKEFAIAAKLSGSANPAQLMPDHGTGTAFGTAEIKVDDVDYSTINSGTIYSTCQVVRVSQVMKGKNTVDNVDLIDIINSTTFQNNTVQTDSKITFIEDTFVADGYVNMIPINTPSFGKRFLDSRGNSYDLTKTDGSNTLFPFLKNLNSIAVIDDNYDRFLAVKFNDNTVSFLDDVTPYATEGGIEYRYYLQHRDATLNKFYPTPYKNVEIHTGFTHNFNMTYSIGEMSKSYDVLNQELI